MGEKTKKALFYNAWGRLLFAYLVTFAGSFAAGIFLIRILKVSPEALFAMSTKRLSYAVPIFESGAAVGIDPGVLLFAWNSLGALITISFLYAAPLFNPAHMTHFPQALRKAFCGRKRMKLLCFLPGCLKIEKESLRRLYVWLMIPWLGMILLGIESGFTVATSGHLFASYFTGFIALVPHGIIEIPAITLAGAVAFSAHLLIKEKAQGNMTSEVFADIESYTKAVPVRSIILKVIVCLLIAGLIEAHITEAIVETLLQA